MIKSNKSNLLLRGRNLPWKLRHGIVITFHSFKRIPDNKVHWSNMGPTRVLRPQMGPMMVPWTLLSEMSLLIHTVDLKMSGLPPISNGSVSTWSSTWWFLCDFLEWTMHDIVIQLWGEYASRIYRTLRARFRPLMILQEHSTRARFWNPVYFKSIETIHITLYEHKNRKITTWYISSCQIQQHQTTKKFI